MGVNPKKVWFTSDLHLNHDNIRGFCDRPFRTVKQMNERLISNINNCVGKRDVLWVLGDFCLCSDYDKMGEFTSQIQCEDKRLIMGNHDRFKVGQYYNAGWKFVSPYPVIFDEFLLLSHTPRFMESNSVLYAVTGHSHNSTPHILSKHQMNVSCDVTDFKPVSLKYIYDTIKKEGGIPDEQ